MSPKDKLYFLLSEFISGAYDVETFCKFASTICNLELPHEELNSTEKKDFHELCDALNRFSPYESDLALGGFISEQELKKIIDRVTQNLHIQIDKRASTRSLNYNIKNMLLKLSESLVCPKFAAKWASNLLLLNATEIKKDPKIFNVLNLIAKSASVLHDGFPLYSVQDFKAWLDEFEQEK